MIVQFNWLVALYGINTIVLAFIAWYAWQRRKAPGGYYFSILFVATTFWSATGMLEMASVPIWLKLVFARLAYAGIASVPPLWLLFCLSYAQRSRHLDLKTRIMNWLFPVALVVLVFTNDWHHLIWTSITPLSDAPGALLLYGHGSVVWVNMAYTYIVMLAGIVLLIRTSMRTYSEFNSQAVSLVVAAFIPLFFNIVYLIGIGHIAGVDPTPIAFCLSGLILVWSMFRYKLFDLVPVARETVVANMSTGVVVLDGADRILDVNSAAREMLGSAASPGLPLASALERWPELRELLPTLGEQETEVPQSRREGLRWFDARASPLLDGNGVQTGRVLLLQDVTRRKLDEEALAETTQNLQTLFNSVDDMILVLSEDWKVLEVNKAAITRLGYGREFLIGYDIRTMEDSRLSAGIMSSFEGSSGHQSAILSGTLSTSRDAGIKVEASLVRGVWGGRGAIFGIARDLSELVRHQEELKQVNVALLKEIEDRRSAERQIEVALHEKEVLLKEVHHRVKNNMQIIFSLLNLQKSSERQAAVTSAIAESQNRIMTLALIHEKLYGSRDLSRIDFADYVSSLAPFLAQVYALGEKVRISVDIEDVALGIDQAIACGLIICELVSNSAKYGFPGERSGTIRISLARTGDTYTLSVADDGVGLPAHIDFSQASSPGFQLVDLLVDQLEGKIELDRSSGTKFTITFRERTKTSFPPAPQSNGDSDMSDRRRTTLSAARAQPGALR